MRIETRRRGDAEINLQRLFLTVLMTLLIVCGVFSQDDARITATWQVQRYDISATLPPNPSDRNLTAKAKVDIKNISGRPASTLTLRISPNAEVSAVAVNGTTADFTKGEEKIANGSLQRIVVRIPSVQPGGTVSATVD